MRIVRIWDFNDGTPQGWTLGDKATITIVWTGTYGLRLTHYSYSLEELTIASISIDLSGLTRPIIIIPYYLWGENTPVSSHLVVSISTTTKTVEKAVVRHDCSISLTRNGIVVIDVPRFIGDDSWRGNITLTIKIYTVTSGWNMAVEIDSIVLCDGADKTIYLPKPQTSLALESKTVALGEEAEAERYLAVSILSGYTKSVPGTMVVEVYYTVGTSEGSIALTPAKTYSDHYEADAYDTSDYLTALSSVVLKLQAGTVDRLDAYTIALVEMDSEWRARKLIEMLLEF